MTRINFHNLKLAHALQRLCYLLILCSLALLAQAQAPDSDEGARQSTTKQSQDPIAYYSGLADTTQILINPAQMPDAAMQEISNLNVRDMDVRDLMRGLGREFNLNLMVDNNLNRNVTVRFAGIPVMEAMIHICRENSLKIKQNGHVFRVSNYKPPKPKPVERMPEISYSDDGTITVDLKGDDLAKVMRRFSELTGQNVVIRNGVSGNLSGFLQGIPFKTGLQTLLANNGFTMRERDDIYTIDRRGWPGNENNSSGRNPFWVNVDEGKISMDVANARIPDLIREIAFQTDISMVTYQLPDGAITAKTNNLTLEQTLSYLFRGTNVTYRKEADIIVIGDKSTSGIATTKLIRLEHIRADVVIEMIPENILQGATIQVVKEQNGLMVIGTNDIILELKNFINEIDYPTPQIMIEALVVDVNNSDVFELGASLGYAIEPDSGSIFSRGAFTTFGGLNGKGKPTGGAAAQGNGTAANRVLGMGGNLLGIKNLGLLPPDFYLRIQALSREGIVNIRSRPQISTLNGHKASIQIGTKQYYILQSSTPISSPNNVVVQENERFEIIEANVSLEITPWVSASGEVTAEIHPEFNTPVGNLNPNVPPTINSRVLDSTVRLQDGETIILGGLIQETENKNFNKIPILGDIPLIGRLFSNRSTNKVKSELVIFITPYVFYGDGYDAKRWNELKDELDVKVEK